MRKHQELIPSVVIILVPWKVHQDWKSQEIKIIGDIEKVRTSLQGRLSKFVCVLVTDGMPVDSTEKGQNVEDFLTNMRKVGGFDKNSLVFLQEIELPQAQLLVPKLSKIVTELSNNYYKDFINKLRKLKSEYKKDTQAYLAVRHRFKLGYFSEILKTAAKAQKYYGQAYSALQNVSTKDFKEAEIRTVGDYINYKLCGLKLNDKPDMAVKQFLSHISWYKTLKGDPALVFQHHALIYRQYRSFAEILESKQGNSQKRYQNPAFYFQAAASAAKRRKIYVQKLCEPKRDQIEKLFKGDASLMKDMESILRKGYVGQDIKEDENAEQAVEVMRPYAKELLVVNHSEEIIQMLSKASKHYKKNQSLKRMIFFIANCIAEEHFESRDFDRAKQYEKLFKIINLFQIL